MVRFDIKDTLTPKINKLVQANKNPNIMLQDVANSMQRAYSSYFLTKGTSNFWRDIARSTVAFVVYNVEAGIKVTGKPGINLLHKIFGGTIRAKNSKYLTIPAVKGLGPARGKNLDVLFGRGRKPYALGDARTRAISYFLKESVTQRPDPTALPQSYIIQDVINRAVDRNMIEKLKN